MEGEITKKNVNFINDIDFRAMLIERLNELDKVFLINANYSTIFLAMSTLEGIFKHIAGIFKTDFKKSPIYTYADGRQKDFGELTIDDFYVFLTELKILPKIDNFEQVYKLFRDYRNFIHPQKQRKKDWPIDLGQAQMALGLLNATIGYLAQRIFIGKEIFQILTGNPDYDSEKVLHLELSNIPSNSFLVLDHLVSENLSLSFNLELPQRSVFNFVFNFFNESEFKMFRLDTREDGPTTRNCLLHCNQKYFWRPTVWADQKHPPKKSLLPIEIKVDFPNDIFSFSVDGQIYGFKDEMGNDKNIFEEIRPNMRIGFFNEVRPVKLSSIKLDYV
ncbi:MAG: hypothetical protein LUQ65_03165 [Candidatus Helarchaeota archaeon]|nr:hypothetical protein [Candidatus Helarchaeota archaeon]